jgi:hypothetical protein
MLIHAKFTFRQRKFLRSSAQIKAQVVLASHDSAYILYSDVTETLGSDITSCFTVFIFFKDTFC